MSKVKAILIDAEKQEVREIQYDTDKGIQEIYDAVGCRCFCIACGFIDNNVVYVDDEGYLNGTKNFFKIKLHSSQWFAGNGLLLKEDEEGNTVDTTISVDKLRGEVVFMRCDDEESCPKLPPVKIISF